jgi:hypothetical protein
MCAAMEDRVLSYNGPCATYNIAYKRNLERKGKRKSMPIFFILHLLLFDASVS